MALSNPHLAELAVNIRTYPELADLLARAIIDNPPAVIRDGGVLKTGYDAELDELQSISENAGCRPLIAVRTSPSCKPAMGAWPPARWKTLPLKLV